MTDRRSEGRWARHDLDLVVVWLALLFAGVLFKPMIVVAFGLAVVSGVALLVRHLRARKQHRDNPPGEFWVERIKD